MYSLLQYSDEIKSLEELKKMSRDEVRQEVFTINNKLRSMILQAREVQKMKKEELIEFITIAREIMINTTSTDQRILFLENLDKFFSLLNRKQSNQVVKK